MWPVTTNLTTEPEEATKHLVANSLSGSEDPISLNKTGGGHTQSRPTLRVGRNGHPPSPLELDDDDIIDKSLWGNFAYLLDLPNPDQRELYTFVGTVAAVWGR